MVTIIYEPTDQNNSISIEYLQIPKISIYSSAIVSPKHRLLLAAILYRFNFGNSSTVAQICKMLHVNHHRTKEQLTDLVTWGYLIKSDTNEYTPIQHKDYLYKSTVNADISWHKNIQTNQVPSQCFSDISIWYLLATISELDLSRVQKIATIGRMVGLSKKQTNRLLPRICQYSVVIKSNKKIGIKILQLNELPEIIKQEKPDKQQFDRSQIIPDTTEPTEEEIDKVRRAIQPYKDNAYTLEQFKTMGISGKLNHYAIAWHLRNDLATAQANWGQICFSGDLSVYWVPRIWEKLGF